jgi:hypothetical protein
MVKTLFVKIILIQGNNGDKDAVSYFRRRGNDDD